ncbi:MAG TPA: STAS domain-containing protein, partial [Solirubrobacteraceae bacterium]
NKRHIQSAATRLRSALRSVARRGATAQRRLAGTGAGAGTGEGAAAPARARRVDGLYPVDAASRVAQRRHPGPGELRLRRRSLRDLCIIEVSGTLNAGTGTVLVDALDDALEGDAGQIVLDLSGLASIDHAGLGAVLIAHLRASDELKRLAIVPGPDPVQRVFDAVQGPFLYTTGRAGRATRDARARGLRKSVSSRPGARAPSARRSR